jgi:hypothetical protein
MVVARSFEYMTNMGTAFLPWPTPSTSVPPELLPTEAFVEPLNPVTVLVPIETASDIAMPLIFAWAVEVPTDNATDGMTDFPTPDTVARPVDEAVA